MSGDPRIAAATDGGIDRAIDHAIQLAMRGRGAVEPNPMVGCVLVAEAGGVSDTVLGEGWHARVGGPHAEPNALADCLARGNTPARATACVTLEPCCHTGKRTPPCVPALLAAGVARVIVGCLDPNPAVNGTGVEQLRRAGVAVDVLTGPLADRCRQLIAPFIARTVLRRPYVTLKWAQTADGFIAGPGSARRQISSPQSMQLVHRLRARCDAIAVGGQTLRADDPLLTVRLSAPGPDARTPLRVVLSRHDVPPAASVRTTPGGELLVYPDIAPMLADLHTRGVTHLLVESGGRLAAELAAQNLADRTWIFRSPTPLDQPGVPATTLDWPAAASAQVGPDTLTESFNPRSAAFALATPSADFLQLVEPATHGNR